MARSIFTPANTAIVLVDHQPGVVGMVQSVPVRHVLANASSLAKLATDLELPLVVTTTRETVERLGTTIDAIQKASPAAYEARIRRLGTLDPFDDPAFVAAVKTAGCRELVIAGVLTDVCLAHAVFSALDAGYEVQVVADASGTTSALADEVTYARMRAAGAEITSTWGIIFDLYPDLGTPEGGKAEAAAGHALILDAGTAGAMISSKVFA